MYFMNAAEARALLFQRKLAEVPVNVSLPDLSALDGLLSVLELSGADMTEAKKLASNAAGEIDDVLAGAAMICASLVMRDTKERVLNITDMNAVAAWGGTIITPLVQLVSKASGFNPEDAAKAKANFLPMDANGSSTSSAESLAVSATKNGANK